MKRIRRGYCSYCSTDKEDERDLEIEDNIITCLNCKVKQTFIPENDHSPYYYLDILTEVKHGRGL